MAPSRPVLSHADAAAVLAACPPERPRGLTLTDFHTWLTDTLALGSRSLAKKVLRLDRDQLEKLARMFDLLDELARPDRVAPTVTPADTADADAGSAPTWFGDVPGPDRGRAAKPASAFTAPRPSRRPPRAGTRLSCRPLSACPGADLTASLVDISPTGLGLVVGESLAEGQELSILLQGPNGGPLVRRVGTVRWWRAAADGRYRVGVLLEDALRPSDFESVAVTDESLSGAERRRA